MKRLWTTLFCIACFALLGMLYWSSLLQEEDLKHVRAEMKELRHTVELLKNRPEVKSAAETAASRPYIDPTYPNLLTADPFYQKTLLRILGASFVPHGTRQEALLGRPENLHPFNNFRDVSQMMGLCLPTVATSRFGFYEGLSPQAALKIEARPTEQDPAVVEYWVHLRDDLYWQPLKAEQFPSDLKLADHFLKKHPVTAYDYKFYYDAVMNPQLSESKAASLRNYLRDIEHFRVVDPHTFVVRWKAVTVGGKKRVKYSALNLTGSLMPLPCFVFQYFADGQKIIDDPDEDAYRTNSVFALNFAHHFAKNVIVSAGPWLFQKMTDEGILLTRNPDYFEPHAVLVEALHFTFKESNDGIWQDFKAGNIDQCTLAPSQLPELSTFLASNAYKEQAKKGQAIEEIDFVEKTFYYIGWNEATPYFQSKNVRKAMTLAIDRNRIIEQNVNNMGIPITGPFCPSSASYDPSITPWPYDPLTARRLLEEEGWVDLNGDGIRDKMIDGKRIPFRFELTYFSKNTTTKVVSEYVATALREIGVDCQLKGVDITDLAHIFDDKAFDAVYLGWSLGTPPEDPRQLWHSSGAKEKGSSNAIGFANKEVDSIIDLLDYEYDKERRIALYHAFHKIIHEEVPYTFLYSPKRRLLYRSYVKNLFIPRQRQDLIPGAEVSEPDIHVVYLDN